VLVADDSVRFGSMVARAFAQAGHDVTFVRGIDDGLALVLEESFDVVLTGLPFSEGRLARLARPMLLVTAFHELAGRDGWSEVIRRPFRLDGLVQRIEAAGVATLGR
jgi:DNA-binding response OmpR family regulator